MKFFASSTQFESCILWSWIHKNRNILITSSYAANAIPVAEYTLSQILFSLKIGWYFAQTFKMKNVIEKGTK